MDPPVVPLKWKKTDLTKPPQKSTGPRRDSAVLWGQGWKEPWRWGILQGIFFGFGGRLFSCGLEGAKKIGLWKRLFYILASSNCRDFCYSVRILCNRAILWYKAWISKVYSGTFFRNFKNGSTTKCEASKRPWTKWNHGNGAMAATCLIPPVSMTSTLQLQMLPSPLRGPARVSNLECSSVKLGDHVFFGLESCPTKNRGFWNPFSVPSLFVP